MIVQASRFISEARHWVGYLEKASNAQLEDFTANAGSRNYTIFGKWYDAYFQTSGFNGDAWCHTFITYCANRVGIGSDIIPYTASCGFGVNWFKQRGRWHPRGVYAPQNGDIIYFADGSGEAVHAGVVTAADSASVSTLEGNTSAKKDAAGNDLLIPNGGGVAAKSYALTSSYILGYGNPGFFGVDNTPSSWAEAAVQRAVEKGLTGDENGDLRLEEPVTAERMLVMLYKFSLL